MPTVTIGDNTGATYSGCEDVYFRQSDPTINYGSLNTLEANIYTVGAERDCVIRFTGLSNITGPVTVSAAALSLWSYEGAGTGTITANIRRCLRAWVETQATWNVYSTGNNWGTAGCKNDTSDRISTPSGTIVFGETLQYYTSDDLSTDVEGWINGTFANNGWQIERSDAGGDSRYRSLASSEHATATIRPYLTVTYSASTPLTFTGTSNLNA